MLTLTLPSTLLAANPFEIQSSSADTAETRRDLHRWVPTLPPPTPTTPGFSPGPRSPRSRESEHSFQTESVSLIASQSAPSTRSLRPESRPISELVDILPTPNTNVSIPLTPPPSAFISPRTMDYRYAYAGLQPELRRDPFSDPDPSLNPFSDPGPSYVTVRRADSNNTHAYVYAAPREVEFEREHDGAVAVSKPPPAASTRSSVDAVSITTSSTLPPSYRTHRPTVRSMLFIPPSCRVELGSLCMAAPDRVSRAVPYRGPWKATRHGYADCSWRPRTAVAVEVSAEVGGRWRAPRGRAGAPCYGAGSGEAAALSAESLNGEMGKRLT